VEDKKLIPAHVFFAKWFIRIRWISILIVFLSCFFVTYWCDLSINGQAIYLLTAVLIVINIIHYFLLQAILKSDIQKIIIRIKREIHFQVSSDLLILTLILHFSGGIENPMIMLYFLHMIIASSIFSRMQSLFHAGFAILLLILLAIFEHYGIIHHYHLNEIATDSLYHSTLYLIGFGLIFIFVSVLVVSLTHLLKYKSIAAEESYVKTNQELEKKDKVQNQYVMRVTHDIKGHLAAILSRLSVVRSKIIGPLTEEQDEFIGRAYSRTEQLSDFVHDILSLSRKRIMEESENEEFSIRETIDRVVSRIRVIADDKSIEFDVTVDKSVDKITGNPLTIEELYSNLLRNSIYYTPEGGQIRLSVKSELYHIFSQITDSGIGIPKDEIPKIFGEFYRGSNAKKAGKQGSGLGLTIVKQIVDNHQGNIWVDSEPGIWTKFTFTIPKSPELSNLIDLNYPETRQL